MSETNINPQEIVDQHFPQEINIRRFKHYLDVRTRKLSFETEKGERIYVGKTDELNTDAQKNARTILYDVLDEYDKVLNERENIDPEETQIEIPKESSPKIDRMMLEDKKYVSVETIIEVLRKVVPTEYENEEEVGRILQWTINDLATFIGEDIGIRNTDSLDSNRDTMIIQIQDKCEEKLWNILTDENTTPPSF